LMPDLVDAAPAPPVPVATPSVAAPAGAALHAFSDAQLSIYGIYELQILEGVLRGRPTDAAHREAVQAVAEKVRAKIGYQGTAADDERFLREFYVAQRAHLEQRMLFGQRREDKFSK
ncbi:MAG: hypothetical protein ACREBE_21255, partial [bacterium]